MTYQTTRVKTAEGDYILSEQQIDFLRFYCKDVPYAKIADWMGVMVRTVDGYRDEMFDLLEVRSRTGIILWCFKSGLVKPKYIKMIRYKKRDRRGKEAKAKKKPL